MIEEGDAEGVRGLLEPAGDLAVLEARLKAPRGVIMRHYHRAGSVGNWIGVDSSRVNDRTVD